ncbi:UDP-N-acetylglucosamine transferase subunit ALG14-like protein, partial [Bienertia sinuspersici]
MIRDDGWLTSMAESNEIVTVVVTVSTLILLRFMYVLHRCGKPLKPTAVNPLSTLIVLGSGGHTAEMINLLLVLQKDRFMPRYYVAAASDDMSLQKARTFESSSSDEGTVPAQYMQIYRSREVGQSYLTSVGTTLIAIAHALWLMIKIRPQVILCNGPGTCIPWSSVFYMESIARVKRLSLSGLLLYKLKMADQLYVQWPQLQSKYPRSIYVGRL